MSNVVAQNLFAEANLLPRSAWLPFFNSRLINNFWLLTNRMGDWDILSQEEYSELHSVFTPASLIERLAERKLVIYGENTINFLSTWQRFNRGFYTGPYLHIVHLTQRCNLGCSYCHSSAIPLEAKGRDLSFDTSKSIAEFIANTPSNRIHVNFQGGEPTVMIELIDSFSEYLKELCINKQKQLDLSVTTNGTLLTKEVISVLKRHQINVTVSIDGPADIHDQIRNYRNGQGSHNDALSGIEKYKNATGLKRTGAILVLTRKSIQRIHEIIDEYVELKQPSIALKAITRLGGGIKSWDKLSVDFEEYWEAYIQAVKYMLSLQSKDIIIFESSLVLALSKILEGRDTTHVDFRNPCGLVYGILNYDIDGKIYACHEGKRKKEFFIGDVRVNSPEEVLLSQKAASIAASSVLDTHSECKSCAFLPYCGPCPAHNYQLTGSREVIPYKSWECLFTLRLYDWIFSELRNNPKPILTWWRYELFRQILH